MRTAETLYYRVHWKCCPEFSAENAYSVPWGCLSDDECSRRRGYSCCSDPSLLLKYFERRGEPAYDETVVVFAGNRIDHGDDGEDLVVPSEVVTTMTWSEFKTRFRSNESFEDTVRRACRECDIDSETADLIVQYDLDDVANRVAAIRDMKAFCVARNAEWNEEADAE